MANEITFTGSLSATKAAAFSSAVGRSFTNLLFNMSGTAYIEGTLSVLTSATVIPLGGMTTPGWCVLYNLDATNFIRIMNGSGGAKVVKIKPGEPAIFPWDDTATPYAQADTATCLMEYLILAR